jgi:hypothetical protein
VSDRWKLLNARDFGTIEDPYLDRLRIVQTPLFGIYLHHIHRADKDPDPHDHPWGFFSLVLSGWYTEHVWLDKRNAVNPRWHTTRHRERWSLRMLRRRSAHIITEIGAPLWTLVITGPDRDEWGFWTQAGYVPWREYLSRVAGRLGGNGET